MAQQYGVDIVAKVAGVGKVERLEKALKRLEGTSGRSARGLPAVGRGAAAAGAGAAKGAVGVKAFGTAVNAALGPIGAALAAVGGLAAAFNTISNQDFAEAKFESLGGNADQLVTNLKAVSNELQGAASVAELTGAAYDVASAGFSSAAEASLVLKAASQGATGGFSDINTVANATTSVLNAYGMSANEAAKLVDQFIQTQNDGKIVVAEYAANIGKVASAAAGLNVPMSEVNAVIAQSTAAGVQAEVAFTGLKGALARLASGEAAKALKGTGIEINAATIEADGLLGTLKKLEGLDTGTLFKALGTEAGPALLPVIQNLEKYEELVRNQEDANGTAAAAAATAAGTIEGAWKRVTVAFQNLFSDQTELGQLIRGTLLAAAATVEALAAAFKLLVAPIRAVIEVVGGIVSAMTGIKDGEAVLQSFTAYWFKLMQAVEDFSQTVIAVGRVVGQYIGALVQKIAGVIGGLWTSITDGVQGIISPIADAFANAFDAAKQIIEGFWNSLPGWLKGALEAAGSVVGGVTTAVQDALNKVAGDIQSAKAEVEITVPEKPKLPDLSSLIGNLPDPTGGAAGGGAGRQSQVPQLQQELDLSNKLLENDRQRLEAQFNKNTALIQQLEQERIGIELAGQKAAIALEDIPPAEKKLKIALAENEATLQTLELKNQIAEAEQKREEALGNVLQPIEDEIELLQAKLNGNEEEIKQLQEIRKLKEQIASIDPNADTSGVETMVKQRDELRKNVEQADALKSQYESLASGIASDFTNAFSSIIDGSKSADEAFADMLKSMAKRFLDMAMKILQDAITQQLTKLFAGLFGGIGGGGGGFGSGYYSPTTGLGTAGPNFGLATGGRPDMGQYTLVGETGPELVRFDSAATVEPASAFGAATEAMKSSMSRNSSAAERQQDAEAFASVVNNAEPIDVRYDSTVINNVSYVTEEQMIAANREAVKEARARVFSDMRNKPSTRQRVGLA